MAMRNILNFALHPMQRLSVEVCSSAMLLCTHQLRYQLRLVVLLWSLRYKSNAKQSKAVFQRAYRRNARWRRDGVHSGTPAVTKSGFGPSTIEQFAFEVAERTGIGELEAGIANSTVLKRKKQAGIEHAIVRSKNHLDKRGLSPQRCTLA